MTRWPVILGMLLMFTGSTLGDRSEDADRSQPSVVIEAVYPGANARVVADTVAGPIEQQVHGVAKLQGLMSRCTNDGRCILVARFQAGTDLEMAQVLVQNRVALSLPVLPELVQRNGVVVRKKQPVRMIVNLSSPNDRYDAVFLSNYAVINVRDELARLPGVAEVTIFGQGDHSMRLWLDPQRLAARNLSANDVLKALAEQNVQIAPGKIGRPPAGKDDPIITTMGRLADVEQFGAIVIKTDGQGAEVRLKEIGRVEKSAEFAHRVSFKGKPSVALAIYPLGEKRSSPDDLRRAVHDRVALLRARLPEGLRLEVAVDLTPGGPTAPEYLLLDVNLPDDPSMERIRDAFKRYEKQLGEIPGVQDLLSMTENPFDLIRRDQPCMLIRLASAEPGKSRREEITRAVRASIAQFPEAAFRVRDLSRPGFPGPGYAIDLAVRGPETAKVQALAEKLGKHMEKDKKLTDVWVSRDGIARPGLFIEIDRARATAQGMTSKEIFATLQVYLGSVHVDDFNRFNRTWQVVVPADAKIRTKMDGLLQLKLRNDKGEMVALSNIATVRKMEGPTAINRLDLRPMVQITANPAAELTIVQARTLCEAMFEETRRELKLSAAEYRLTWLQASP